MTTTAQPKLKDIGGGRARRSVAELTRLIHAEMQTIEAVALRRFEQIGEYLTELRPQIPAGQWQAYIQKNLPFSFSSATRYVKFYEQASIRRRTMERLSDVDPPRPNHQSHTFRATQEEVHRAKQYRDNNPPPPEREPIRAVQSDAAFVRELCARIIAIGYRTLAIELHPDRGGSDRDMRCLTRARDTLKNCIKG